MASGRGRAAVWGKLGHCVAGFKALLARVAGLSAGRFRRDFAVVPAKDFRWWR